MTYSIGNPSDRSEDSLWTWAWIFKHIKSFPYLQITGKIPIAKPWYTFLAILLSSIAASVHEAKRDPETLFKFSCKGIYIHGIIRSLSPSVWHLPGRWKVGVSELVLRTGFPALDDLPSLAERGRRISGHKSPTPATITSAPIPHLPILSVDSTAKKVKINRQSSFSCHNHKIITFF